MYIRDQVSSVTRPVKELRGFARVTLPPGTSQTVRFTLGPEELSLIDRRMQRVVEPGRFDIMVGTSATPALTATLDVVPLGAGIRGQGSGIRNEGWAR